MPCPVGRARARSALAAERWARADLPLADQIIAAWAAMLGRSFDLYLLARVSLLPEPVLQGVLADLESHQLIRRAGEGRYQFVDDGLRQAARRQLLGPDRRRFHATIARVLGELGERVGSRG
jgi:predicted ATPase